MTKAVICLLCVFVVFSGFVATANGEELIRTPLTQTEVSTLLQQDTSALDQITAGKMNKTTSTVLACIALALGIGSLAMTLGG